MKESLGEAEELDGFEDLNDEDKARVQKAWEEGHVDPEDVPETQDASIAMTEEEEKELKKKQRAEKAKAKRAEKKAAEGGEDDNEEEDEEEEKPKKKSAAKVCRGNNYLSGRLFN